MSHDSSSTLDWAKTRLVVFSQDDAFRFLTRTTFRQLGIGGLLSTSVAADANPLLTSKPDLVMVDLDVAVDEAFAFLNRVRSPESSPCPEVPVAVIANGPAQTLIERAAVLGIEGVIRKPISAKEMTQRVASIIRHPMRMPGMAKQAPPPPPRKASAQSTPAQSGAARPIGRPAAGGGGITFSAGGGGGGSAAPAAAGRFGGGGGIETAPVKASGGGFGADDVAPAAPAKASALLGNDDFPTPTKAPARIAEDDLAPPPATAPPKKKEVIEAAEETKAAKKKKEKSKAEWDMELAEAGHTGRSGSDVPAEDATAIIVAEHGKWLQSNGTEGSRANFEGKDMAGADLAATVLAGAGFRRADLSDAALAETRLDGADLRFASLSAADCRGATMGVAQMRHADLRLANLEGANLRGADLSGAKLRGARLTGADFSGATLVETDLREADLSGVENLKQAQVDKAVADDTTKLPIGLWVRRAD